MESPKSLKNILTLNFLFVAALPILIMGTILFHTASNFQKNHISDRNLLLAKSLSAEVEKYLHEPLSVLTLAEKLIGAKTIITPNEANTYLSSIISESPYFNKIMRIDRNGKVLNMAPVSKNSMDMDMSRYPFFHKTLEIKKSYWSSSLASTPNSEPNFIVSLPSQEGIIAGYLKLSALNTIVEKLNIGESGYAAIIDRNGTIIGHPRRGIRNKKEISKDFNALYQQLSNKEGSAVYLSGDISKFGSLVNVSSTSWYVIVSQHQEEAFQFLKHIRGIGGLSLLVSILLAFIVARLNFKNITRPFSFLREYTDNITKGNYHPPLLKINTFKEIDKLADNFRAMSNAVKEREASLRKREECFRQIVENVDKVFWVVSPDWEKIFYISPSYEKIWERSCQSLYDQPLSWIDSIPEIDKKNIKSYIEQNGIDSFSGGTLPEYRIMKQGDSSIWVQTQSFPARDNNGHLRAIVCISEDITERKLAVNALPENENRYRLLIETINNGILVHTEDGKINFANDRHCKMLGWKHEDIIGRPITDFLDSTNQKIFNYHINPKEKGRTNSYELTWTGKGGNQINTYITPSRIPAPNGKSKESIALITDISNLKKEAEILSHSIKKEAIGKLAGGMTHDFNNLLSSVFGYADLAIERIDENNRAKVYIQEVLKACNRAKELITHILAFSRKVDQKCELLQINQIVKESLKHIETSMPSTITIRQKISPQCGKIISDSVQIHKVLLNLCTNAAHAMSENGIIEIGLENITIPHNAPNEEAGVEPGDYIMLSVQDTGIGISPEIINHIFDPYFTTKKAEKAKGLGLTIVYGIVKNHDGAMKVDSKIGKGSTFKLFFPKTEPVATQIENKSAPNPSGNENILVVDDDKVLAQMVQQMLTSLGYSVTVKTDGQQALEYFKSKQEELDLIFTDQTMPNLTGTELAEKIFEIKPNFPIILCTGHSSIDAKEATKVGIKGFAMKPLVKIELANLIRNILDQKKTA